MTKCSVCGEENIGTYSVCRKCQWINDPYCDANPDDKNMLCSLNFARKLYAKYNEKWMEYLNEEWENFYNE